MPTLITLIYSLLHYKIFSYPHQYIGEHESICAADVIGKLRRQKDLRIANKNHCRSPYIFHNISVVWKSMSHVNKLYDLDVSDIPEGCKVFILYDNLRSMCDKKTGFVALGLGICPNSDCSYSSELPSCLFRIWIWNCASHISPLADDRQQLIYK